MIGHIVNSSQWPHRQVPEQSQRISYARNAEYHRKTDGMDHGRKPCLRPRMGTHTFPRNQRGHRAGKAHWKIKTRFAYDVCEGFQVKGKKPTVHGNLYEHVYNRRQFQLSTELLVKYCVSLTFIFCGISGRLGNLNSTPQQLTLGLPQGPSYFSPLHFCTKGLAGLNSNELRWVLTHADDGLIYETVSDTHTASSAVQEQLDTVSYWCQEAESEIK